MNGLPLLDQLRFFEQSAHLAFGLDPLHPAHLLRQVHLFGRAVVRTEVRQHPLAQVVGLANVQRQIVVAIEQVHAMMLGQGIQQSRVQMHGPAAAARQLRHGLLQLLRRDLPLQDLPELPQHGGVGQRAVTRRHVQAMTLHQGIEIVLAVLRIQLPRQLDRAQHRGLEIQAQTLELVFQEPVVKPRVVSHEKAAMQTQQDLFGQLGKGRRTGHHLIGDARQTLDETRNRGLRVDQTGPLTHLAFFVHLDDADFGDAVHSPCGAGGFQVHKDHRLSKQSG